MNELAIIILTAVLGGGLFTGLGALIKAWSERRKNEGEAEAQGILAPANADSIQMKSMALAVASLSEENQRIYERLAASDAERERDRADRADLHREVSGLRRALQAAQDYIEAWIEWGHRVAPDEPQPKPPKNYRNY